MRVLTNNETANVNGGILFLAPVTVAMLADASFWGAMSYAFGVGVGAGKGINWLIDDQK